MRHLVPDGIAIQEFEGTSWVGAVLFRMEGVTLRHLPDVPGLSAFAQLNLRLYVEVDGKPGVWFVSLDSDNRFAVWAARRFFHVPYFHAEMSVAWAGERMEYRSARSGAGRRPVFGGRYWPTGAPLEAKRGSLEYFLTERYCFYAQDRTGAILRTEVHHQPWPLQPAAAEIDENTVATSQGINVTGPPMLLHFSRRLDVAIWPPEKRGGPGDYLPL